MQYKSKLKKLIAFDETIVDILNETKYNLIVAHLFLIATKLKMPFNFITQSQLRVPKNINK